MSVNCLDHCTYMYVAELCCEYAICSRGIARTVDESWHDRCRSVYAQKVGTHSWMWINISPCFHCWFIAVYWTILITVTTHIHFKQVRIYDGSWTVGRHSADAAGGHCCICNGTASGGRGQTSRQSLHIFPWETVLPNFIPVWFKTRGFLKSVAPNDKNNKVSSDMKSVLDPKITCGVKVELNSTRRQIRCHCGWELHMSELLQECVQKNSKYSISSNSSIASNKQRYLCEKVANKSLTNF